ncbi:MAG: hypothetical protein ABIT71_13945 [Vicinamibacteraceae bacterium]
MTIRLLSIGAAAFALVAGLAPAASSQTATAAGHWTGVLDTPAQTLDLEVDLKPGTPPAWVGTISIPVQNLKAFPLSVEVQGTAVSFVMASVPGTPTFKGTLAADGATISGDFSQGGGSLPLRLTRKGDAVFATPAKSTAITKDLEGTWSGSLAVGDKTLRLTLKLANGADGATGSIVSVDQGSGEIPLATITQKETHLTLELPSINGSYSGDLTDGKLVGTWRQGPGSMPLEFSRSAP